MSYRFKAALCGFLATLSSGYGYAALDEVAQAVSDGDYGAAQHALDASPELQRQSVEGRLLQAAVLAGNGKLEQAEARYKALIEQAPGLPEAYNNLATLYARQGRLDEARKLLEQAMRTNPSYATVYDNLSSVYLEMSRSAYAKALQISERNGGPKLKPIYAVTVPEATPVTPVVVASVDIPEQIAPAAPPATAPDAVEPVERIPAVETKTPEKAVAVEAEDSAAVVPEAETAVPTADSPVGEKDASVDTATSVPAASRSPGDEQKTEVASDAQDAQPPVAVASADTFAEKPVSEAPAPAADVDTAASGKPVESAVTKPATAQPREEVIAMLKRWAADWAGQNVEGYLDAYAMDFQPGHGLSLAQWQAQRRNRLGKPSYIEVQLGDFNVTLRGEDRAVVDLVQHYRSDRYSDLTRKRLRLVRQPEGWKIVSEKTLEVL